VKTVPLHGKIAAGRVALVDDGDYELVVQHRWNAKEENPRRLSVWSLRHDVPHAARAYDAAALETYGEYACVNFPGSYLGTQP
jgi:hypothetical protein